MSFRGFVTNLDLYVALCQHNDLQDYVHLCIILKSSTEVLFQESINKELENWCRQFCYRLNTRWMKSKRIAAKFMQKNSEWLSSEIQWPQCIKENVVESEGTDKVISPSKIDASTMTVTKISRKSFEDLTNRHKRRRADEVRASTSQDELVFSTECALKSDDKGGIAKIMKHLLENPEKVSQVLQVIKDKKPQPCQVPTQKALALFITMRLSKWRYITLRDFSLKEGLTKYPSYNKLLKEKAECYPSKEDITITNDSARIKIQALLDLTIKRLIKSLNIGPICNQLVLHSKWGFDGASNQSIYHQKSSTHDENLSTVFMTSLVPLKLTEESTGNILWQNERPSSTIYCRPISFKFMKETEVNVKSELAAFESEISNLTPTEFENTMITHNLMLTMIDGKIHSYISGTSSAVCDICKARPTEMNKLEVVRAKTMREDLYKYGLSSLHAWIRSMECLLHISYRLEIKSWQSKGDEHKQKVKDRKKAIQEAFRGEIGLLLDIVKQGSGNTNTGNVARRFFADEETTARITGLDVRIIHRIGVVLKCISSWQRINYETFKEYCNATANLYVELYPWYYMPSSLHKLLIHGPEIADHFSVLPIGYLSEEASEARNKDFRKYRSEHSRKCNSIATNEDILNNLLLSSDPLLSSIRRTMQKGKKLKSKEVSELLIPNDNEMEFIDVSTIPQIDSESEYSENESDEDRDDINDEVDT
ncbi:hypothetical protein O3G_MSEX009874 [Manduca sexta]|uniref:Uncharacterized protein n=1 Tax=Manduca sexta TaxID=7130 RepID=A0A922CSE6_MANSE|nr:hypothetical protein O3G_MSEX009874 [Manduca sexta]